MTANIGEISELRVKVQKIDEEVGEIHDVVYKDGLVMKVALIKSKVDTLSKNIEKMIWLLVGLVVAFLVDAIGGLILP